MPSSSLMVMLIDSIINQTLLPDEPQYMHIHIHYPPCIVFDIFIGLEIVVVGTVIFFINKPRSPSAEKGRIEKEFTYESNKQLCS